MSALMDYGTLEPTNNDNEASLLGKLLLAFGGQPFNSDNVRSKLAKILALVNAVDGDIDLTTGVTGVLTGANGGTGVANTGKTITLGGNLTTASGITIAGQTAARTYTLPDADGNIVTTTIRRKGSDTSRSNTTTVADDPDLSETLAPGVYTVEINAIFNQASGTPGVKFSAETTGGTGVSVSYGWIAATGGGDLQKTWLAPEAGVTSSLTEVVQNTGTLTPNLAFSIQAKFTAVVVSETTLSFKWAQETSSADATTLRANSVMIITKHS